MSFGVPLAAGNGELLVRRAQLRGLRPSPVWNGTLAAPSGRSTGHFASFATDSGAVVVVEFRAAGDATSSDSCTTGVLLAVSGSDPAMLNGPMEQL